MLESRRLSGHIAVSVGLGIPPSHSDMAICLGKTNGRIFQAAGCLLMCRGTAGIVGCYGSILF